jgi:L-lactate utilization protein LutB
MKINKSQLKQIIKEEMSSMTGPHRNWRHIYTSDIQPRVKEAVQQIIDSIPEEIKEEMLRSLNDGAAYGGHGYYASNADEALRKLISQDIGEPIAQPQWTPDNKRIRR